MEESEYEWISVSEMARRLGKSNQTVYNWISKRKLEICTFKRGTMNGMLVKYKKGQEYGGDD